MQGYGEYVMSYTPSKTLMQLSEYEFTGGTLLHTVLIDGIMAAHWKHVLRTRDATVAIDRLRSISASERAAGARPAIAYGRHLGVPVQVEWL
ncbi:hypothetical protein GY24_04785 [Microterricola pindariensis]|uniref:Uncharacterized protein n=1 Tax=Microterricola pindariensis TaxID=478010 RepID=A0ABX5AYM5_9MICO|nr:hypothetical protein GY24_04785 [Microterricola pindariensis]